MNKIAFNLNKSNWCSVKLGELADEVSQRVSCPENSGYERFVGLEHFVSGDVKIKKFGKTVGLSSSGKAFKSGDILFARRNAYLRRASLVDFDGVCSGDAFVLRENLEKVSPGFLAFLSNSEKLWDYANENAAGTMSKRVKWRDLADFEILLPPKVEQLSLLKLFWSANDVVDININLNLKTENLKKSIFEEFLSKHINNNLLATTIGDIACTDKYSCIGGPFGSNLSGKHYVDSPGVPVIRGANLSKGESKFIDDGFVFVSEEKAKSLHRNMAYREDIIVTQRGTMGQVGIIPENSLFEEYVISQSQMKLTVDRSKAIPDFIYFYLLSQRAQRHLSISTISTGIPHINLGIFKDFPIYLPTVNLQKEIVEKMALLDEVLTSQRKKLHSTKNLLRTVINEVF